MRLLGAMGIALLVGVAAPEARACESEGFYTGLNLKPWTTSPTIAEDGVLAVDAYVYAMNPEDALAKLTLTVTASGGGPVIAGEVESVPLDSGTHEGLGFHRVVVVWRPTASLAVGAYDVHAEVADQLLGSIDLSLTVEAGPGPPPSPPNASISPAMHDGEALERVCCETGEDSCGGHLNCEPTRVQVVPGFNIAASLVAADRERASLWIARWEDGAVGPPLPRPSLIYFPEEGPLRAEWPDMQRFPTRLTEVSGEVCIVAGATSLVDGSVAIGAPVCGMFEPAFEEGRAPVYPAAAGEPFAECLTPPVFEADGSPYPRVAESGCRISATRATPLALLGMLGMLGMLVRRRRRGGSPGS